MVGLTQQSPFVRAFYDYLQSLPPKTHQSSVLSRIDRDDPPTAEKLQEVMLQIELKHDKRTSIKMMKRVMGPFVTVVKDYYGVFDTLCQADPTPGIVLWGCLKIAIDGMGRFIDLFDKIKAEVQSMTNQIGRLTLYEDLYGQSPEMQECLFKTYKNVFRFWCRVDKECKRCSLNSLLRASTSFSMKKLQAIMNDLRGDSDEVDKLVPIIEGQYANRERYKASHERDENKKEREEGSAWRKQLQSDRIRSWLGGQMITASNLRRHVNNVAISHSGSSCDWLLKDPKCQEWIAQNTAEPVLWLFAGPGSGKSVLCSYVVEYIQAYQKDTAVAFHFCEFDDQRTALSTAQILATQLFERFCQDIPEDLQRASRTNNASLVNILNFIRLLVTKLPRTYFFIDGLDEEATHGARWNEIEKIIDFINLLATEFPSTVRVWYSTQDRFVIRRKLDSFASLDIKQQVKGAVDQYISTTVPGIGNPEVDQDTRNWMLTELRKRADGNFLWASLMLQSIEDEVSNFDEMEQFIKKGLPQDLYSYYRRIFAQYQLRDQELASQIFALVTFAKRRLRMTELREAIGMLSPGSTKSLRSRSVPWRQAVQRLFSPLIEMQQDPEDSEDPFCHLFHGTVKAFLLDNANIFQGNPGDDAHLITEATIGKACLRYLAQQKYTQFLVKANGGWVTTSEESVKDHHLLTYSAKYWDRHLEAVEESSGLRLEAKDFINSANLITTLQVQSLFVEGRFEIYTLRGCSTRHKYTKRVFPDWIASTTLNGSTTIAQDYRSFISDWQTLLHYPTCENEHCRLAGFPGQLDRCLWKALGPQNFLSRNRGRYNDFMLCDKQEARSEKTAPYHEGIAMDGSEILIMQVSCEEGNQDERSYRYETWNLNANHLTPNLCSEAILSTNSNIQASTQSTSDRDNAQQRGDMNTFSFTTDLSHVRVGSRIFSKPQCGEYFEIVPLYALLEDSGSQFEDIASRDSYFILTARRKKPIEIDNRGRVEGQTSQTLGPGNERDLTHKRGHESTCQHCSKEPSASDHGSESSSVQDSSDDEPESSDESSSLPDSDESEASDSAEESWSEGSTEVSDGENSLRNTMESSGDESTCRKQSEEESDASEDRNSSDAPAVSFGQLKMESDSEGGDFAFDCGSDDDLPPRRAFISRRSRGNIGRRPEPGADVRKGLMYVYDLRPDNPVQLFKFSHPLPIMLYKSPPVIHPMKPLVVWPLCGGGILFADFEGKTYFIRKARPTTDKTRHISIQCHFSACGKYLHIVSFEAQQQALTKAERKANTKATLSLSALITTHRLSARKTSRSPPILIHRAKVSLGSTKSLCSTRMPAEVTWAPKEVYLASSSQNDHLVVFRVQLFAPPDSDNKESSAVSVPRTVILLPGSARSRCVHYFPPKEGASYAMVLIGSWAAKSRAHEETLDDDDERAQWDGVNGHPETTSPPIGFYVSEEADLGGWGPSSAVVELSKDTEKGMLKQKMERFVAEDDCGDLETYFFA